MRILLCAYYPFFGEHLAGGLQVSVGTLVRGFVDRGHQVVILCPECEPRPRFAAPAAPGLEVLPVLREQRAETVSPTDVSHNLREIRRAAESTDLVWSLDRSFPVQVSQPVVLSLSAVCYENELSALFGLTWDHLIVPSDFVMRLVDDWLPRDSAGGEGRGRQSIPPPLGPIFRHQERRPGADAAALRLRLGLPGSRRYLLFPHRPEDGKGHELALKVLAELLRHAGPTSHGEKNARRGYQDGSFHMLIPRPPLSRSIDIAAEANYLRQIEGEAARLGVSDHVTFHDWVDYRDLPAYYSLGECCLFLSRLPESFGLALVQSIACGTFVVSSGSGALEETVPTGAGHVLVANPDPGAVARAVLDGCPESDLRRGQAWVAEAYDPGRIVDAYLDCFVAVRRTWEARHGDQARVQMR